MNVTWEFTNCSHGEKTGLIVTFHDTDPECEGAISWCPYHDRETWELISLEPLTIQPSIQCKEHQHHHGFITESKWVPA